MNKKEYIKQFDYLKRSGESWRTHWKELAEYMMPRHGRYLTSTTDELNAGQKKHQKVINGSAKDALRVIGAGLQGGLTSPSRPWFNLGLDDSDLMQYEPVKYWLSQVRQMMLTVLAKSNFYGSIHGIYQELACFGSSAMLIDEDFKTVIRCRPFTIGEFYLDIGNDYRVNTLARQFSMTSKNMVQEYGENAVSKKVYDDYKNNNNNKFEVVNIIQPNRNVDPTVQDFKGKLFESITFETANDEDGFLKKSGYNTLPFVAPRWEVVGTDVYGSSPAMDALGDAKMLQKMEEKKLKGLDKQIDPPMNAPMSMKSQGGTIIAGGVNYIDTQNGQQGFTPTYQVSLDMQSIAYEIDRVEQRIRQFFYNPLFLSIINNQKTMTATEVAERHEEKIMMLGSIIERLQSEFLDIIIERVFNIMSNLNLLPPPPKEIQGRNIKIDYISVLAQAQKMIGISSIEQTFAFVANLAQVKPEVLDKFNADEAIDMYSELVGTPPKVIISDDKVAQIRQARQDDAEKQQQAEQAMAMTQATKNLAESPMGEGNALDKVSEMVQ